MSRLGPAGLLLALSGLAIRFNVTIGISFDHFGHITGDCR